MDFVERRLLCLQRSFYVLFPYVYLAWIYRFKIQEFINRFLGHRPLQAFT